MATTTPGAPGTTCRSPRRCRRRAWASTARLARSNRRWRKKTNLSSILEVIDQGLWSADWVAVPTSAGGFDAIFWVFKDALMHKTTGRRWPCSPHEAQLACAKLRSTPSNLTGWPGTVPSKAAEDSLFLTPRLMDLRWAQAAKAGQAIEPRAQNVNGDVAVENGKLNTWVDSQIKPGWLVADPGKIWALTSRLGGTIAGLPTACKHGHNTAWIDYSQLLILVSGWCAVRATGTTDYAPTRTEDVYTSTTMAPLVTADGKPLKFTKQPLPQTPAQKKTAAKQAQLEQDVAERRFRLARIEERTKAADEPLLQTV
jgi:hypothetical protein